MRYSISICIFLFIALKISIIQSLNDIVSSEYDLYQNLFNNYTKSIRPVKLWNETVDVFINLDLKKIANVVENHQTMLIYVALEMRWTDYRLKWDSSNNIESIVLPADKIWVPDLHLFNSAVEDDRIYPLNVEIFSNGTVQAFPINQLYAHCDFDFSDFPYDSQTCEFMIGNVIEKSKVKIWIHTSVNETKLLQNNEWKYVSLKDKPEFELEVPGVLDVQDFFNADWSVTKFSLTVKRASSFYVNLFIWPLLFILVVGMCLFILPPTCVERATMGVLLLLTLVVMSLMLDSFTPKSSTSISIIGRLISFAMFMITWSTFVSTLIIGIDKDNFTYRSIPTWLRNLMLKYIGKIICKYETIQKVLTSNPLNQNEEIELLDTNQIIQNQSNNNSNEGTSVATSNENLDLSQARTLLVLISNQLGMLRMRIQEKDSKDQNKKDWYVVAVALDRFCLLIYFIILLLGIFILFI